MAGSRAVQVGRDQARDQGVARLLDLDLERAEDRLLRQPTIGITDENDELLLHRRWLLVVAGIGLHREIHFFDYPAQNSGGNIVLLQNLCDLVDLDFSHDERKRGPRNTGNSRMTKPNSKPACIARPRLDLVSFRVLRVFRGFY